MKYILIIINIIKNRFQFNKTNNLINVTSKHQYDWKRKKRDGATVLKSRFMFSLRMYILLSATAFTWVVIDNRMTIPITIRDNNGLSL